MNRREAIKALAGMAVAAGIDTTGINFDQYLPTQATFTYPEVETVFSQIGLFSEANGGMLIARHTFESPILKKAMEDLEVTYTWELEDTNWKASYTVEPKEEDE
jgi:hypothetical protein